MIPYQPFSEHLKKFKILASPAELQANASGTLTLNPHLASEDWVKAILSDFCIDQSNDPNLQTVLAALFDFTKEKLQAEDFSFNLMLPSESVDLQLRLNGLANWVTSYLSSLALAGLSNMEGVSDDGNGFINDLSKIAQIDDQADGTIGEESDYMELTEYVKAGTLMLYQELSEHSSDISTTIQ